MYLVQTYKSRGVVVPDGFGIAKGFENGIGLDNLILQVSLCVCVCVCVCVKKCYEHQVCIFLAVNFNIMFASVVCMLNFAWSIMGDWEIEIVLRLDLITLLRALHEPMTHFEHQIPTYKPQIRLSILPLSANQVHYALR